MESHSNQNFSGVLQKNSSEEALQLWRNLCSLVKNPKRRFRFTANFSKRWETTEMKRSNQEKLRVAVLVSKAAFHFIHDISFSSEYTVPDIVRITHDGVAIEGSEFREKSLKEIMELIPKNGTN